MIFRALPGKGNIKHTRRFNCSEWTLRAIQADRISNIFSNTWNSQFPPLCFQLKNGAAFIRGVNLDLVLSPDFEDICNLFWSPFLYLISWYRIFQPSWFCLIFVCEPSLLSYTSHDVIMMIMLTKNNGQRSRTDIFPKKTPRRPTPHMERCSTWLIIGQRKSKL